MSIFGSMRISGSALTAQRLRMDVIAGNVANAATTRTEGRRESFKRQQVVFEPLQAERGGAGNGLQVSQIVRDPSAARQVLDPTHPDADPDTGLVEYPNVDVTTEMTDLLSATRAYEANVTVMNAIKQMAQKALDLGRP